MQRFVSLRAAETERAPGEVPVVAVRYLTMVLLPSLRADVPDPVRRELRTLAEALDRHAGGELVQAAGLLMRRFQAVELAASSGWKVARRLEAIPETNVSSLHPTTRDKALRKEQGEIRTAAALKNPH